MFSRSSGKSAGRGDASPAAQRAPSIISADMKIVGDLQSDGEIHIDGQVDGDIRTKALLVGETALVRGEIHADVIEVHGRVDGQIKARTVHLAKKAHVVGDIVHEDLSIETGAFLEGHCKRIPEKKETAVVPPALVGGKAAEPKKAAG